jgi:hypothetical protein
VTSFDGFVSKWSLLAAATDEFDHGEDVRDAIAFVFGPTSTNGKTIRSVYVKKS